MAGDKRERAKRPLWDYLFFDKKLPRKPEVLRIAALTGHHRRWVFATLLEFWSWMDDHYPGGFLPGLTVLDLSAICPETSPEFWRAVSSVGWLIIRDDGIEIPHPERWLGETSKKRLQERLRKWLDRQGLTTCPVSVRPGDGQDADQFRSHGTQEIEIDSGSETKTDDANASSCPEPPAASGPPILTFPCNGNLKTWDLDQGRLDGWAAVFPGLAVLAECRKALAWLEANPGRRKTARGMPRFLYAWLERAQNRPRPSPAPGPRPDRPTVGDLFRQEKERLAGDQG